MSDQYLFGPQKISDLLAVQEGLAPHVFGVLADVFDPLPLKGIKSIGFIAKVEGGQFDFDLMDTMIQYRQIHCPIFLEVPFDFEMTARDVLIVAHSVESHVIVTPPSSGNADDWARWSSYVEEFLAALLELPQYGQELLPVTSYIQYMSMSVMGYQPATLTDNSMMHEYFEKDMDVATMDILKERMQATILGYYGGKEEFEVMVHSTLSALHDNLKNMGEEALTRIQEALDNGEPGRISAALLEMLERKSFPSESSAQALVNEAMAHESGLLAGLEVQLGILASTGSDEEAIEALSGLILDLRQLSQYRKS